MKKILTAITLIACILGSLYFVAQVFFSIFDGNLSYIFCGTAALCYGMVMNAMLRGLLKNIFNDYQNIFLAAIGFIPVFVYGMENELVVYFMLLTVFNLVIYIQCYQEIRRREHQKEAC